MKRNAHDNLGLRFSIDSLIAACFTCALVVLLCSRIVIRLCVPMELSFQILRISDNLKSLEVTKGIDEGRRGLKTPNPTRKVKAGEGGKPK